jgi:Xaa-Pro dipeptidase
MSTLTIPAEPDLIRMRRERGARLQKAMSDNGIDALLLLGNPNVTYATGASWPVGDSGRANVERPVAVVVSGDPTPHLFTSFRDDAAVKLDLPDDHLHGPVYLDFDEGVDAFGAVLADLVPTNATIAVDDVTGAMRRNGERLFASWPPAGVESVLGPARIVKTPDELAVMREGLRITAEAMADVQAALAPGVRQTELTARFLRKIFDLGGEANILDPIWQVIPDRRDDMPWTTHGDVPCPLLTTERELAEGDVLWVDTGISYGGYHSDFGRTWVVSRDPSPRQQAQYHKWKAINDAVLAEVRPGVTAATLTATARAVCDGASPWLPHFYLSHSLGVESAEMPFTGTDLGDEFDETIVLAPGMVLVIEPVVWDEGAGGYRSENVYAVTEEGWTMLSHDYPYAPYGD